MFVRKDIDEVTRKLHFSTRWGFLSHESTKSEEIATATRKSEKEEKREKRGGCRRKSA